MRKLPAITVLKFMIFKKRSAMINTNVLETAHDDALNGHSILMRLDNNEFGDTVY
jgi:hypothetical protein